MVWQTLITYPNEKLIDSLKNIENIEINFDIEIKFNIEIKSSSFA